MSAARRGRVRKRAVSVHEVARLAGVSPMTVSRVANDAVNVSAATREKVRQAIEQLGFVPNHAARGLRSRRSLWVALVFQRSAGDVAGDHSYVVELQDGVIRRCGEEGYHAAVEVFSPGPHEATVQLRELVQQLSPDGVLLAPPGSSSQPLLAQLRASGVPFVRIAPGSSRGTEPCVRMDDQLAARQMTEYLLSLGHRRIGFVQGHPGHDSSVARLVGYREALRSWRTPVLPELVVPGDFSFEGGRRGAARLLDRGTDAPTAIFACNDESAAGCLAEAQRRRLRVPGEVSIVGFDDTYVAAMLHPPLTTIRQSIREMGRAAAGQLLALLEGAVPPRSIRVPHQLVERQSAAAPGSGRS